MTVIKPAKLKSWCDRMIVPRPTLDSRGARENNTKGNEASYRLKKYETRSGGEKVVARKSVCVCSNLKRSEHEHV